MRFSIKEWRRFYDRVHELGRILHEGRPTYDALGRPIPPVAELSLCAQKDLESQIQSLLQRCGKYLNQCGKRPYPLLYKYERGKAETHASSPQFKYRCQLAGTI